MFSVEGDPSYGPVIILADGSSWTNVAGCIALTNGDTSASSCGAKDWAEVLCRDAACNGCYGKEFPDCTVAAARTVCAPYDQAAACRRHPAYAACEFPTWKETFIALGAMFCSAGIDGGGAGGVQDSGSDTGDSPAPSNVETGTSRD
jgi:hypothetical protein